jgi:glycosyltransferase involved in cell wall biosynthesis
MSDLVSVIIPTYNRSDTLPRAVDSALGQTHGRVEVIVVDDGSSDGTPEALAQLTSPTRLIVHRLDRNRGPGVARNAGVAIASGGVLAFTDSDCEPTPGWLAAGVAALGPGVDVVQGRTLPDPTGEDGAWVATQRLEQFTGRYETCNIFYRAEALRSAGGFDESLGFFGEDMAAGWQVRRAGGEARFCEDAIVFHAVERPGFRWFLRRARYYDNWSALVKRYPEMRREVLWARYFLRRDHAELVLALLGLLLAPRWRGAAALAGPYVARRSPRSLNRGSIEGALKAVVFDVTKLTALLRGSAKHRALVL